jgi:hypothetical protein
MTSSLPLSFVPKTKISINDLPTAILREIISYQWYSYSHKRSDEQGGGHLWPSGNINKRWRQALRHSKITLVIHKQNDRDWNMKACQLLSWLTRVRRLQVQKSFPTFHFAVIESLQ